MTGFVDKVKNALQSEKNTPGATAANHGQNEYGHATHATGHGPGLHSGLEGERRGSQLPGLERGEHLHESHDPHNKLSHATTTETDNVVSAGGVSHHSHGHHHGQGAGHSADRHVASGTNASTHDGSGSHKHGIFSHGHHTGTNTTNSPSTTGTTHHNTGHSTTGHHGPGAASAMSGAAALGGHHDSRSQHHSANPVGHDPLGAHGSSMSDPTQTENLHAAGSGHQGINRDVGLVGGAPAGTGYAESNKNHSSTGAGTSTTSGPHKSDMLNKLDPRVDSDRDGSRTVGGNATNTGASKSGVANTHHAGTASDMGTTAGPHGSNAMNKADPRVDSNLDGSRGLTSGSHGVSHGNTPASGYGNTMDESTSTGMHNGTTGHHGGVGGLATGNSASTGMHSGTSGHTGGVGGLATGNSASTGMHNNSSGYHDASGITGTNTTSSTTTGPHKSSLLNKLDPRDHDASKTMGQGSGTSANTTSGSALGSSSTNHGGRAVDILHPGDHVTATAKRLDPNYQ